MAKNNQGELPAGKKAAANVYYVPASVQYATHRDVFALDTILAHRRYPFLSQFKKEGVVAVKSCENFPTSTARYAAAFVCLLKRSGQSPFICSTSNRHMNTTSHAVTSLNDALDTHSSKETMPCMALDGIYGEHEISRKTHGSLDRQVYLAGELPNLDGLISVCCFVPSDDMAFSGSIVNLGQGLASKKGKIHQRTTSCPQVNVKKCYACRRCVRACPSHAIAIVDDHVSIDPRKCIKCGKCVEIAHYGGITYDWNATPDHYSTSVAKHAKDALAILDNKVACINIIKSDKGDESFAGALVSQDPVAVDCATLDYCINNRLLQDEHIQHIRCLIGTAESTGVGTIQYNLETVAY